MNDAELKASLIDLILYPPKQAYTSTSGGIVEGIDLEEAENQFFTLIHKAGYVKLASWRKEQCPLFGIKKGCQSCWKELEQAGFWKELEHMDMK